MPELPEVETVINSLRPFLINQEIISVNVKVKNLVAYPEVDVFIDELTNKKIIALARRGKYILIKLNDNKTLIVHLRMTGK